jgi:hypothetical protein
VAEICLRLSRLELPRSLRIKVANANYRDIMDRCSFVGRPFAGCKPRFFNALMVILKPVHVIPGDTIVFKDEVSRELYFVYQGALRVVHTRYPLPLCIVAPAFDHESRVLSKITSCINELSQSQQFDDM